MNIEYLEDTEEAIQIARVALPLASKFQIPANPVSYAVLYEHVGGQNPELSNALKELQRDSELITHEDIKSLYKTFINNTDAAALDKFRMSLGEIMNVTTGSLEKIENDSQYYQDCLGHAADELSHVRISNEVEQVIKHLILETQNIREASIELRAELAEANQELESLKSEFSRVRTQSLIDPLTGSKNRRAFDAALESMCESAEKEKTALSLLMIDIDHFKRINDTHGHIAGDSVLKWAAKIIGHNTRGSDVLARFGGEEFTVLLPGTNSIGATRVAENIRVMMGKKHLRHNTKDIGLITCSIGIAAYDPNYDFETFLSRADEAMYRAKNSGRDRVCVYTNLI